MPESNVGNADMQLLALLREKRRILRTLTRFEAEWIAKQSTRNGEWDPDLDEYECSYHDTREAAERAAIRKGKKARWCEWACVTEQHFEMGSLGIREWVDQRRWHGDWEGNWVLMQEPEDENV